MGTFASRLYEAMELRGMKQAELAEKSGISKGALSSYLSGRYEAKQKNIYRLAEVLDVNPAWLLGLDAPLVTPDYGMHPFGVSEQDMPLFSKKLSHGYERGISSDEVACEECAAPSRKVASSVKRKTSAESEQSRLESPREDLERLKFALFGGENAEDIDDELMEDVRAYAKFKLEQKQKGKAKDQS